MFKFDVKSYNLIHFFVCSYPKYMAPEVLLLGFNPSSWFDSYMISEDGLALCSSKSKSDIWSVGMILLEMAIGMELLIESRTKLCITLRKVMSWIHAKGSAVDRIIQDAGAVEQWKVMIDVFIS